jgi:hypothetical protein
MESGSINHRTERPSAIHKLSLEGKEVSDLFSLSAAEMKRIEPYFPLVLRSGIGPKNHRPKK